MAEREGFEPPELSLNGFQDRRHKPLGHLSVAIFDWVESVPHPCGGSAGVLSRVGSAFRLWTMTQSVLNDLLATAEV